MNYNKQIFKDGDTLNASQLNHIEDSIASLYNDHVVDLFMMMGQSNMAGRGVASQSIVCKPGHGYEFRAISDPTKLYDIIEPFGKNENNKSSGVTEATKTGSLVSAFCEKYYNITNIPIVAVSCSKGGTGMDFWNADGKPVEDAVNRYNIAKQWLINNSYTIRHSYMLWLQGESDGGTGMTANEYQTQLIAMFEKMKGAGIEKCFIIRIGNAKTNPTRHTQIIKAQTQLCKQNSDFIMVNTTMDKMGEDGLMKDEYHLLQSGYNIVGTDAAINAAFYVNNGIEPYMIDRENNTVYFPFNMTLTGGDNNSESEEIIPIEAKTVEFTFSENIENGLVFDEIGDLNNNVLTISEPHVMTLSDKLVFDNDKDWTFECIALPSTATGLVIIGSGSTDGGFIQLPNPNASNSACLRLRDLNKTISLEAPWTTGYNSMTHFAITYSASSKEFNTYINYNKVDNDYSIGSAETFNSFSASNIFGGYTDTYNFIGDINYLKFTAGRVLSVDEFKK